jgi:hypothetical protein
VADALAVDLRSCHFLLRRSPGPFCTHASAFRLTFGQRLEQQHRPRSIAIGIIGPLYTARRPPHHPHAFLVPSTLLYHLFSAYPAKIRDSRNRLGIHSSPYAHWPAPLPRRFAYYIHPPRPRYLPVTLIALPAHKKPSQAEAKQKQQQK